MDIHLNTVFGEMQGFCPALWPDVTEWDKVEYLDRFLGLSIEFPESWRGKLELEYKAFMADFEYVQTHISTTHFWQDMI